MTVPKSHPRYVSLQTRKLIANGVTDGITSLNGLIAHGRGEAFDYLLGEKTHDFATHAINRAAMTFVLAKHPVISVNGNTAALVPKELIALSQLIHVPLEINLFHSSVTRLNKIKRHLYKYGARNILLPDKNCVMPYLDSNRKYINAHGIAKADVVFVPLEDGDRTAALIKNGKKVITIDLNPLSRTAQAATITIVDNIVRALPALILQIKQIQTEKKDLNAILKKFDNKRNLSQALKCITGQFLANTL